MGFMRTPAADYPAPAFARAIRAFDDFDACATEYQVMLSTQRALIASGNIDGVVETATRGDVIARRAATCGRRLAPVRESLDGEAYVGPRINELRRRLVATNVIIERLHAAVSSVSATCAKQRDEASAELGAGAGRENPQRAAYMAPGRPTASVDIRY